MTSSEIISAAGRMINYTLFPPMLFFDAINFWTGMAEHMYLTGRYRGLKSFYNLSPLAAKLRSELDPGKVSRSGTRLRIAMTGLESGELREMLPVQAAVDLGAAQVYAIACSKSGVGTSRSFDVVEGGIDAQKFEDFKRLSDEITGLRLNIWKVEHLANGEPGAIAGIKPMPGPDHLRHAPA